MNNLNEDEKRDYIDNNLDKLYSLINELYEDGIPIEAMMETFNQTINQILEKNDEKGNTK